MLPWGLGFFVAALVAALLDFGGIVVGAAGIAKLLISGFVVLALIALVAVLARHGA